MGLKVKNYEVLNQNENSIFEYAEIEEVEIIADYADIEIKPSDNNIFTYEYYDSSGKHYDFYIDVEEVGDKVTLTLKHPYLSIIKKSRNRILDLKMPKNLKKCFIKCDAGDIDVTLSGVDDIDIKMQAGDIDLLVTDSLGAVIIAKNMLGDKSVKSSYEMIYENGTYYCGDKSTKIKVSNTVGHTSVNIK